MKLKKWIALVLAFALALGLTGCVGHFYDNALTIDGTEISSGLYLMAQLTAYDEASRKVEDTEKSPLKQKIDGKSGTDWVRERALELCKRYVAVHRLSRDLEVSLSSERQQIVEQNMQYWPYLVDIYEENGISEATYRRFYSNQELANQLFETLYADGGELAVPDDELKALYEEQFGHIRYISVPITTGVETGTDLSGDVYTLLDAIVERLEGGATLEEVAKNDLAEVYALLEREFVADTVVNSITTSYIPYNDEESSYSEAFRSILKTQTIGDYGYAEMSTSALLYEVIPMFDEDTEFEDMRATVLSSVKADEFEDYLRGLYDSYSVNWVPGARWFLRPSKIKD